MSFESYEHDVNNPNETKEEYLKRFVASLPTSIQYAKSFRMRDCNALIVHGRIQYRNFNDMLASFFRGAKLHNLPRKAQWACEELTRLGYAYEIGVCGGIEGRACHRAVFIILPG